MTSCQGRVGTLLTILFSIRDNKLPAPGPASSYSIDTEEDKCIVLANKLPRRDA